MGTAGSPTLALPTVAEVLALPPLAAGEPEVLAGAANLDRRVRWAHVSEIADIAGLLHGGELLLTTGVALPDDRAELAAFVDALDDAGAAGLVVELGRRYQRTLPPTLVRAAQERGLPLVALRREVRFVAVTEAVHALVVDARLRELRASEEVHQTFTELSVEGAEPVEVVRQAARMSGRAVVLENLAHQVLAYDAAGGDPRELLDGWETRSRAVDPSQRTGYDERSGWLVTVVGARGHDWGRLVLVAGAPPPPRDVMLVERAASTLALNRLVERDRESLERQTHRSLLSGILSHSWPASEVALRARALGVPLEGRRLVGVVLRPAPLPGEAVLEAEQRARDLTETAAAAVRTARVPALVGSIDDVGVGVLLSLGPQLRVDGTLDALAAALARAGRLGDGRGLGRRADRRRAAVVPGGRARGGRRTAEHGAALPPARGRAAARSAAPAARRRAAADVRGARAVPAAALRRRARHRPDRAAADLPRRGAQQVSGGRRGPPVPAGVLRAAAPHRAGPRRRPRRPRGLPVLARGPHRPGRPSPHLTPGQDPSWVRTPASQVPRTGIDAHSPGSAANGSTASATRSARIPTSSRPHNDSSKPW